MKATVLMFLAAANLAGRVDGLKSYKAMPTDTDMAGFWILAALLVIVVLLLVVQFVNWMDWRIK